MSEDLARFGEIARTNPKLFDLFLQWYSSTMEKGALEIRSQPPGAHVFVDGTPSGLRTPTVLTGLPAGRRVQVRLDKPGYEPVTEQVTLTDGQSRAISLTLRPAPAPTKDQGSNP